jgi:hypothetical protein
VKKSIIVVGTHLTNYKSNLLLTNLIHSILETKIDYGLVSNSLVSGQHYKHSKFFIYDSENEKFNITPSAKFWFQTDQFIIESPFLFYGSLDNYSYGATNLFINAVLQSKKYGYDFVHWIEYDTDLLINEINENEKIMTKNGYSAVVYKTNSESHPISGSFISLNLNKINLDNFYKNKKERIDILNQYGNSSEKFTKSFLLKDENIFEKDVNSISTQNKFNQATNNPVEFVFFNENEKTNFFIKNNSDSVLKYNLKTNLSLDSKELKPLNWVIFPIGNFKDIQYILLEFLQKSFFIDTTNKDDVEKYINVNKYKSK